MLAIESLVWSLNSEQSILNFHKLCTYLFLWPIRTSFNTSLAWLFCQKQSDWLKNCCNFRIHIFVIGCWIRWASQFLVCNKRLIFLSKIKLDNLMNCQVVIRQTSGNSQAISICKAVVKQKKFRQSSVRWSLRRGLYPRVPYPGRP